MNTRELERLFRINTIKATLAEAEKQEKEVDENKLIMETMMQFAVTRKTALEYIEVARFKNNAKQELCEGKKEGVQDSQSGEG